MYLLRVAVTRKVRAFDTTEYDSALFDENAERWAWNRRLNGMHDLSTTTVPSPPIVYLPHACLSGRVPNVGEVLNGW